MLKRIAIALLLALSAQPLHAECQGHDLLPDLPADEHAAWTVVASMILNLDEVLTRN